MTDTAATVVLIGYAPVSTSDQDPSGQHDALRDAGCVRVYTDRASGAKTGRPELARALERLEPGDVLVVARLDRLGRSLPELIEVLRLAARSGCGRSRTSKCGRRRTGNSGSDRGALAVSKAAG